MPPKFLLQQTLRDEPVRKEVCQRRHSSLPGRLIFFSLSEINIIRDKSQNSVKKDKFIQNRWPQVRMNMTGDTYRNVEVSEINLIDIFKALKCVEAGQDAGCSRVSVEMQNAEGGLVVKMLYLLYNIIHAYIIIYYRRKGTVPIN